MQQREVASTCVRWCLVALSCSQRRAMTRGGIHRRAAAGSSVKLGLFVRDGTRWRLLAYSDMQWLVIVCDETQ